MARGRPTFLGCRAAGERIYQRTWLRMKCSSRIAHKCIQYGRDWPFWTILVVMCYEIYCNSSTPLRCIRRWKRLYEQFYCTRMALTASTLGGRPSVTRCLHILYCQLPCSDRTYPISYAYHRCVGNGANSNRNSPPSSQLLSRRVYAGMT